MQLTTNFKLEEFSKITLNEYQLQLVKLLANNLQIVRDNLQPFARKSKQVSITITSGVRTQEDYNKLIRQGYNPSKKSDHFCGVQIDGNPTLGAADIIINNCSLSIKECARRIIEMTNEGLVNFGQVIYEYNPATKKSWIHLGNDWKMIFKDNQEFSPIEYFFKREKYLMSMDNGKTYKKFK